MFDAGDPQARNGAMGDAEQPTPPPALVRLDVVGRPPAVLEMSGDNVQIRTASVIPAKAAEALARRSADPALVGRLQNEAEVVILDVPKHLIVDVKRWRLAGGLTF